MYYFYIQIENDLFGKSNWFLKMKILGALYRTLHPFKIR